MRKIILILVLFLSALHAQLIREPISMQYINSGMPIVDIRTVGEWEETGIIKGAIPLEFFDARGHYDLDKFLKELNAKVDTKKRFGLICNSGSRTRILAAFLANKLGYDVVDFKGGILYAKGKGLPFVKYIPNK